MPIRVLHVISSLMPGGAELMVKRLCFAFDRDRIDADVVAIARDEPEGEEIFSAGFEERGLHFACLDKKPGRPSPAALLRLARMIRKGRYDIVHTHCLSPGIYGRIAASLVPGTLRLVTIHLRMDAKSARLERWLAPFTDHWIACSTEAAQGLRDICRFPESKYSCIANGTAGNRALRAQRDRKTIRSERGVEESETVALVLARLQEQKGHLDLLEAISQPGERIQKLKLWLAGQDQGAYADRVKAMIVERGLASRVEVAGPVSDAEMDELIKGADLFLLPSHYEGMSVAILEALAAGLPTVISDVETNREVTDNGRVGFLTPPKDPRGLAAALETILSDPEEMAARGRAAAQFAEERFSFKRVVREYTEAYEALVGSRGT